MKPLALRCVYCKQQIRGAAAEERVNATCHTLQRYCTRWKRSKRVGAAIKGLYSIPVVVVVVAPVGVECQRRCRRRRQSLSRCHLFGSFKGQVTSIDPCDNGHLLRATVYSVPVLTKSTVTEFYSILQILLDPMPASTNASSDWFLYTVDC
ncbi:hypothetical protein GUJ93_ZPchr0001g32474 [Zizania palustris]|uniref:Uncharacterized protein n=1 Tax=Zizania palustris TaxID=103762 RepID=A0A8J5VD20_ZIZPA|nr:hypothetical protein GUJ93_ZPchr0001g32474 [Zizania palustris]